MEILYTEAQYINKRDSPRHGATAPASGCYPIFPIQRLLRCISNYRLFENGSYRIYLIIGMSMFEEMCIKNVINLIR